MATTLCLTTPMGFNSDTPPSRTGCWRQREVQQWQQRGIVNGVEHGEIGTRTVEHRGTIGVLHAHAKGVL